MNYYFLIIIALFFVGCNPLQNDIKSNTYYFDPINGDNMHDGKSSNTAFKDFSKIESLQLGEGDTLKLKSGATFHGSLELVQLGNSWKHPLVVTSTKGKKALIDASGFANGILLENTSNIVIDNIAIKADGGNPYKEAKMRCGILYTTTDDGLYSNIRFKNLEIKDIFYNKKGINRGKKEVVTANGTQAYGWGIRVLLKNKKSELHHLNIDNCTVNNVAHTGIKLTGGKPHSIQDFEVSNCIVSYTGGPGIQMSKAKNGHVYQNIVDHSGSDNDSRKWGRGSGLWTWGSDQILIEKNKFMNASGPGDSAGAHIDFNCNNIVLQYNYSSNNVGGFLEILGNNYNCSYRYNISVNDGDRTKGVNGAFQ